MIVSSKSENYRLYESGTFGNKFRTWSNLKDLLDSGFGGRVVMRYKGFSGGANYPHLGEQLTLPQAKKAVREWRTLGAREEDIKFNEAAPDDVLLIQGEIMRSTEHISLFWSREKTTMRKAMQNAQQSGGLYALSLLRTCLFPASMDDVQTLLDKYPDSVIEFSAYGRAVGGSPRRNAVIWEVRNY